MKKNLFLLGLAVAAMTSCTNDEVLDVQQPVQKAIGFESFVNKTSRAVTPTTTPSETKDDEGNVTAIGGLEKFYAYGYYQSTPATSVFDGIAVTRYILASTQSEKATAYWNYDLDGANGNENLAYWTSNIYQFGAYANGNDTNPLTFTEGNKITFEEGGNTVNLTIPEYNVSDQNDLVAAITTVDNSSLSNDKVNMDFKHLLTKIKFSVKNNDTKYKMRITSALVIKNVYNQGKCVVSKNPNLAIRDITTVWTPAVVDAVNYSPLFTANKNDDSNKKVNSMLDLAGNSTGVSLESSFIQIGEYVESDELFVMPQDLAGIQIQITASFYDGNSQEVSNKTFTLPVTGTIVEVTPASGETPAVTKQVWAANTYYNYIISLPTSATPIEFGNVTVGDWTTGKPIELNPNGSVGQ